MECPEVLTMIYAVPDSKETSVTDFWDSSFPFFTIQILRTSLSLSAFSKSSNSDAPLYMHFKHIFLCGPSLLVPLYTKKLLNKSPFSNHWLTVSSHSLSKYRPTLKWVTQSNDINGILNFFVLRKK
jgi:hypothetical protein